MVSVPTELYGLPSRFIYCCSGDCSVHTLPCRHMGLYSGKQFTEHGLSIYLCCRYLGHYHG